MKTRCKIFYEQQSRQSCQHEEELLNRPSRQLCHCHLKSSSAPGPCARSCSSRLDLPPNFHWPATGAQICGTALVTHGPGGDRICDKASNPQQTILIKTIIKSRSIFRGSELRVLKPPVSGKVSAPGKLFPSSHDCSNK